MKVKDLIAKLKALPKEDEIFIVSGDDILGNYCMVKPQIVEDRAVKYISKSGATAYECTYSNYIPKNGKEVSVWVIS
jgi:hypothetical protein